MRRQAEVDAPDGEHYVITVRRSNPYGANVVAIAWWFIRWAWRFGRWTVQVDRRVPWAEYRHTLLPYAFHWYGPAMGEAEALIEFDRVVAAITSGHWPDPSYQR